MDVQLVPDADPSTSAAVEAAILLATPVASRGHPAYHAAWRLAALVEGVDRPPDGDDQRER